MYLAFIATAAACSGWAGAFAFGQDLRGCVGFALCAAFAGITAALLRAGPLQP